MRVADGRRRVHLKPGLGFPALGTEDLDLVWLLSPSPLPRETCPQGTKGWAGGPSRVPSPCPLRSPSWQDPLAAAGVRRGARRKHSSFPPRSLS